MIPIGVTTKKNIAPIIIGEIILPKKIPNLNHNLLRGFKIFELISPKKRKIRDTISDQIIIAPL